MKKPIGIWLHTRENRKINLESYPIWVPADEINGVTKKSHVPLGELRIEEVTIVHMKNHGVYEVKESMEDVVAEIEAIRGG